MSGRIGHGQLGVDWSGSISTGTHRTQDLIPKYAQTLAHAYSAHFSLGSGLPRLTSTPGDDCCDDEAYKLVLEFDRIYQAADTLREFYQQPSVWAEGLLDPDSEMVQQIGDDMFEALTNAAPEGFYFGTAEGDGADFGFWSAQSDEEEANIVYDTNPNDDPVLTYDVLREVGACDEWCDNLEKVFGKDGIPINARTFQLLTSMGDGRSDRLTLTGSRGLGGWMPTILNAPSVWNTSRGDRYARAILASFTNLIPQFVRAAMNSPKSMTDEMYTFFTTLLALPWAGHDIVDDLADLVVPSDNFNPSGLLRNTLTHFHGLTSAAWEARQYKKDLYLRRIVSNAYNLGEALIRMIAADGPIEDRELKHVIDIWAFGTAFPFIRDAMIDREQALELTAEPATEEAPTRVV